MPIYEYRCAKCGDVFEVMQKFSDTQLSVHEACGGSVERLISRSGFSLKGSGWYATDYAKSGSTPKKDSNEDSSKNKTESKDSKSTESKPAESKPAESNPAESKPSKSSESKTESKPSS